MRYVAAQLRYNLVPINGVCMCVCIYVCVFMCVRDIEINSDVPNCRTGEQKDSTQIHTKVVLEHRCTIHTSTMSPVVLHTKNPSDCDEPTPMVHTGISLGANDNNNKWNLNNFRHFLRGAMHCYY